MAAGEQALSTLMSVDLPAVTATISKDKNHKIYRYMLDSEPAWK